jgi:hypothetical protein
MFRRVLLGLLFGTLALLGHGAVAARAQAADVVTLLDSTATLPPTDGARVTFPVTPAENTDLADAKLSVLRLRRDQVELPLPDGLKAAIEVQIPAVILDVPTDELPDQGSYGVLLAIRAGTARQLITLTLIRPAAQVTAPTSITVKRTTSWLWFSERGAKSTRPRLTLITSGDTRLLTLSSRQVEAEDPQVTVGIDAKSLPVPPNGSVALPYLVTGAPDPGTVTRSVQLSSPQLSAPVAVTFTITTRRHPGLIAVALLAGVLLGLVLRRLLPTLTSWRTAQLQRRDLDEQLAAWRDEYQDPDFRTKIEELRQQLRQAKTRELTDVITSVRAAATEQLQGLQNRLMEQDGRFRAATAVFRRPWQLPADETVGNDDVPGIQAAVNRARAGLDDADEKLARKNATAASDALLRVDDAARDTSATAVRWGDQVRQGIGELNADLKDYDRGALANLKVALASTAAGAPVDAGPEADLVRDAENRLGQVHATMQRYAAARPYLAALAAEAEEVARGLTEYGFPAQGVTAAAKALRDTDSTKGHDPSVAGSPIAQAVRELVAATREAIESVQGGNDPVVQDPLNRGDLVGAANELLNRHRAPAGAAGGATRLGGRTQAALAVAGSTASGREFRDPAVVLTGARAPITDRLRTLPSARTLALAGFAAEFLHVIAAVAVVLFTGYALFLPTWTGTFADLAQVVFWAFAVDISIAGLTALVTSQTQT